MAAGLNKVTLIGNLGRDPEVRYTQSGNAVSNLSVAVTERRKDGDDWKDQTEWVNVVCFGRTAENVGQFLAKGRQVYVEGRMQTREWQDNEGNKRRSTEVVAHNILFLGGKESFGKGSGGSGQSAGNPAPQNKGQDDGFYNDDMPF